MDPITLLDVLRHIDTSPSHTAWHRYTRVLTERYGWDAFDIVRIFVFREGSQEELRQAYAAVTLRQPALAIAS